MPTFNTIRVERDAAACIITLNRPERRNAISIELMRELMDAMREVDGDASVRGVIITGGAEYFAAGADLNEALQVKSAESGMDYFRLWHRLCDALEMSKKPVIAAIEGFCMTGGCELVLACDLRVGAKGSNYAITSSRIGTVAGAGGTQRLPRIVGPAYALEMLFAAEPFSAEDAYRMGLLNKLAEKGQALAEAKRLVELYATRAPLSLALVKRAVHRGVQMDLGSALEFETFLVTTIYGTDDKQEGISAFLEKRKPNFTGR
ncbi:enoyl-CoA hydratase/isomerase family protein [Pseudorhodoplanes sp.]|uniref:enoyl-CoA hydratase/isomerase family protein n=1 Tax=Pseudorhodoplanes sp. TaxID=1934341 RepID=UPI003D0D7C9B